MQFYYLVLLTLYHGAVEASPVAEPVDAAAVLETKNIVPAGTVIITSTGGQPATTFAKRAATDDAAEILQTKNLVPAGTVTITSTGGQPPTTFAKRDAVTTTDPPRSPTSKVKISTDSTATNQKVSPARSDSSTVNVSTDSAAASAKCTQSQNLTFTA